MKSWKPVCLLLILAGCTQQTPPALVRPYLVPIDAAKKVMLDWTEKDVNACFGAAKDSDMIAGIPRYFHERGGCKLYFMFKDGNVHSVEGYGDVQTCWWVADACERGVEFQEAPTVAWRKWTIDEVAACFGQPQEDRAPWKYYSMRTERDGCSMMLDLNETGRLSIDYWSETKKGAYRQLLRNCDDLHKPMS